MLPAGAKVSRCMWIADEVGELRMMQLLAYGDTQVWLYR